MKPKKPSLNELTFKHSPTPVDGSFSAMLEGLCGRGSIDRLYRCEGIALSAEVGVVRTYPADAFVLCIKVGGRWIPIHRVMPEEIAHLDIVKVGLSPAEQRKREQREAEERERAEAVEREQQARSDAARARQENAARLKRERMLELQQMYGIAP